MIRARWGRTAAGSGEPEAGVALVTSCDIRSPYPLPLGPLAGETCQPVDPERIACRLHSRIRRGISLVKRIAGSYPWRIGHRNRVPGAVQAPARPGEEFVD